MITTVIVTFQAMIGKSKTFSSFKDEKEKGRGN
jgi:hypothetical protein